MSEETLPVQKIWATEDGIYRADVEKCDESFVAHVWMTEDGQVETLSRAAFEHLQLARQHCHEIIDIARKAGVVL